MNPKSARTDLCQSLVSIRGVKILSLGAVCEIMWENVVERGKQLMTIWLIHVACGIPNTTSRHVQIV